MIGRRARRGRRALAWAAALLLPVGCARSIPPPGGPVDTTPPVVLAATPADSAVNVARIGGVEFLFSEAMDRASVRDNVRIYPPVANLSYRWNGRRFRVEWGDSLEAGTTYQLILSGRARDLRGVPVGTPTQIRFSTGATLAPGRIEGRVRAKVLPFRGVPVILFPDSLGMRPDTLGAVEPSYHTETDTAGVYRFSGLPLGRGFTVMAFYDKNADSYVDPETDVVAYYREVVRLTPERTLADSINIVAVDPRAPAVLSGSIAAADSIAKFTIEARATADSVLVARTERVGPGPYSVRVPPGSYRLRARRNPVSSRPAPGGVTPRAAIPEAVTAYTDSIVVGPEGEAGPFVLTFPPPPAPEPAPSIKEEPR